MLLKWKKNTMLLFQNITDRRCPKYSFKNVTWRVKKVHVINNTMPMIRLVLAFKQTEQ